MNQFWNSCVSLLFVFGLTGSEIAYASNTAADKKKTESYWPSWITVAGTGAVATVLAIALNRLFAANLRAANMDQANAPGVQAPRPGAILAAAGAAAAIFGDARADIAPPPVQGSPCCMQPEVLAPSMQVMDDAVFAQDADQTLVVEEEEDHLLLPFMTPEAFRPLALPGNGVPPLTPMDDEIVQAETPIIGAGSAQLRFRIRNVRDSLARTPADMGEEQSLEPEDEDELARALVESLLSQQEQKDEEEGNNAQRNATPLQGRAVTLVFDNMGEEAQHDIVTLLQTPNAQTGDFLELTQPADEPLVPQDRVPSPEPIVLLVDDPSKNNAADDNQAQAQVQVQAEVQAPAQDRPRTARARGRTVRKPTRADLEALKAAEKLTTAIKPRRTERTVYRDDDSDGEDISKKLF